jgi:hypothetical protein
VLALELARAGHDVLLVESGLHAANDTIQSLGDATIAGGQSHVAMSLATRRQVGGASNIWGGRCVPFDPVDFDDRPYVHGLHWPVTYEQMAAYFQRASDWFVTGRAVFTTHDIPEVRNKTLVPGLPDGDMRSSDLERWSLPTNFRTEYALSEAAMSPLPMREGSDRRPSIRAGLRTKAIASPVARLQIDDARRPGLPNPDPGLSVKRSPPERSLSQPSLGGKTLNLRRRRLCTAFADRHLHDTGLAITKNQRLLMAKTHLPK